jgi:uncharacterized protein YdcH (DUF465 family)
MHIAHELHDEFLDEVTLITQLRKANYLFRRLTRRYDEVNGQIYRIESEEEPTTDGGLERNVSGSRTKLPICSQEPSAGCRLSLKRWGTPS